jgi:hypothetical protein
MTRSLFDLRFLATSLMLGVMLPWAALAQHASSGPPESSHQVAHSSVEKPDEEKPDGEKEGDSESHAQTHAPRHVSVFVGGTSAGGHRDFTIGAEATHRLPFAPNRLSAGALADVAFHQGQSTLVAGAGLFAHPVQQDGFRSLKLLAIPAVESHNGHQKFLFRTGVGYDLHVGGLTLTPTLNFDFVDGHVAEVFGVSAGIGF